MKKLAGTMLVLIMLIYMSPVNAGDMTINPKEVYIPIGGTNSTNVTITLNDGDGIGKNHTITISFYNATTGKQTDKLNGSLSSDEVSITFAGYYDKSLYYTWTPNSAGTYNFTLTLWFEDNVTLNETFKVKIDDDYINEDEDDIILVASCVGNVAPIPELASIALVAVGLVLVAISRRW